MPPAQVGQEREKTHDLRVLKGEQVEVGVHKLIGFMMQIIASLVPVCPALALRLYFQCALVADVCGEEADAYDLMAQVRMRAHACSPYPEP